MKSNTFKSVGTNPPLTVWSRQTPTNQPAGCTLTSSEPSGPPSPPSTDSSTPWWVHWPSANVGQPNIYNSTITHQVHEHNWFTFKHNETSQLFKVDKRTRTRSFRPSTVPKEYSSKYTVPIISIQPLWCLPFYCLHKSVMVNKIWLLTWKGPSNCCQ